MSHTESKPAASAASVRSRITSKLIRSCGRNSPNQGRVTTRLRPVPLSALRAGPLGPRSAGTVLPAAGRWPRSRDGRAAVDRDDLTGHVVGVGREEEAGHGPEVGGFGHHAERDLAL